ncbi:hypothetical protein LZ31DRAFT_557756 [Colletotrichum somersetense]|nr:hypothetical protein LZ31DRAFT_557756 [Colletotrichum somersetense]
MTSRWPPSPPLLFILNMGVLAPPCPFTFTLTTHRPMSNVTGSTSGNRSASSFASTDNLFQPAAAIPSPPEDLYTCTVHSFVVSGATSDEPISMAPVVAANAGAGSARALLPLRPLYKMNLGGLLHNSYLPQSVQLTLLGSNTNPRFYLSSLFLILCQPHFPSTCLSACKCESRTSIPLPSWGF